MAEQLIKKTLIVAGIPGNKKVVKFKDAEANGMEDKWYVTSEKIQALDLAKYGIVKDAQVEVSFSDDEAKMVVFMKKTDTQPASTTKAEDKPAETVSSGSDIKVWTIDRVAKNKEVLKFKEDTETWRKLSDEIKAMDFEAVGIKRGNTATVTLEAGVITTISITANSAPANVSEQSSGKTNNIDNQSAVKSVAPIVNAFIEKGVIKTVDEACVALEKLSGVAKNIIGS